jgi:hypothetical protein
VNLEASIDIIVAEIPIGVKPYSSRRGKLKARWMGEAHTVAGRFLPMIE